MSEDSRIIGSWNERLPPGTSAVAVGQVSLQLTERGNLVHCKWTDREEELRFLRWRLRDGALETIEPETGHVERLHARVDEDGVLRLRERGRKESCFDRGPPRRAFEASDAAVDLALFGLAQGLERLREHGRLQPFLISEADGDRTFATLPGTDRGAAVERAREVLAEAAGAVDLAVLCFEGLLPRGSSPRDAVIAELHEQGQESAFVLGRRYRPAGLLRKASGLGSTVLIGRRALAL